MTKTKQLLTLIVAVIAFSITVSGCDSVTGKAATQLAAAGTISARTADIAPEISGKVMSISVDEGAHVKEGDELFRVDDTILKAQRDQAEAALATAQAQYDLVLNGAHLQDRQNRLTAWTATQPDQFTQPVWYFDKEENLASARSEMDAAAAGLSQAKSNVEKVLSNVSSQDFLKADRKVSDAQAAFLIASQVLSQTTDARDNQDLASFAQDQYDAAKNQLNSAQTAYNLLLTAQESQDVLEARARVNVAQERYDRAVDYYDSLLTGEQSLQVDAAAAAVQQAKAALSVLDVQLGKTVVRASQDGVILSRRLEKGETVAAGSTVMVLGQLTDAELIVYIPETEYSRVQLGQPVAIKVDSFASETFTGTVAYIADQAEFTPRNVQTVEGRRATVYAVKLRVPNTDLRLKPGMPADVIFDLEK